MQIMVLNHNKKTIRQIIQGVLTKIYEDCVIENILLCINFEHFKVVQHYNN